MMTHRVKLLNYHEWEIVIQRRVMERPSTAIFFELLRKFYNDKETVLNHKWLVETKVI